MSDRGWIRLLVPGAYVVARFASQRVVTGTWVINRELLAHVLIVPLAQLAAIEIVCRLRQLPRASVTRFLVFWLALTPVLAVVTGGLSFGVFRHIDLTYDAFFQTLVVPTCQALLLTWATKQASAISLAEAAHDTAQHALVVPVLVMDAALLASGWLFRADHLWGIEGGASLHAVWIGTKATVASGFLVARAVGRGPRRTAAPGEPWRGRERVWCFVFGAGLFALGANAFVPWLRELPGHVLPGQPTVIRWLVVYGVLFWTMIALTLNASAVVARRSRIAALYFEAAAAAAVGIGLIVALNVFLRPYLAPPWLGIVRTGISLAATCVLVGAIVAQTDEPNRTSRLSH